MPDIYVVTNADERIRNILDTQIQKKPYQLGILTIFLGDKQVLWRSYKVQSCSMAVDAHAWYGIKTDQEICSNAPDSAIDVKEDYYLSSSDLDFPFWTSTAQGSTGHQFIMGPLLRLFGLISTK